MTYFQLFKSRVKVIADNLNNEQEHKLPLNIFYRMIHKQINLKTRALVLLWLSTSSV